MTTEIQVPKAVSMSMDIEAADKEKLKAVFPQCFTEGKLDIDKLLSLCGEYIDNDFEKYKFEWKGKSECYRIAGKRSTGTLRPCPEESVNFDITNNLYIEGDNLEVLKLLQTAYYRKVKMIYIDPPYNTGNDFVYEDDFKDPMAKYKEITSQTTKSNPETMGRYHTNWLNMMYPRLRLAANLLRDDGVIFISIDDNEITNLKRICDEVFGEENFVCQFPWRKRTAKSDVPFGISQDYEWVVCYAKSMNYVACIEGGTRKYFETEDFPNRPWRIHDLTKQTSASERPNSYFTMVNPKTNKEYPCNPNRTWAITEETFKKYYAENRIVFPDDYSFLSITKPAFRYFKDDDMAKAGDKFGYIPVSTKLPDTIGMTQDGTKEINDLFDQKVFGFPKPLEFLKHFIKISTVVSKDDGDIILDFFSGSATTAHAVMQLNAEDGGKRQFILVQLPEVCDETSEAFKAGYKNICEIGKERIRRAGTKILESFFPSPLRGEGQGEGDKLNSKMDLLDLAKDMRHHSTEAEKKLWYSLNNQQLGYKFRRQHQIGNYIVDFVCLEKKLVVECDGGQHTQDNDKEKSLFLEKERYQVLRFWNNDILSNLDGVLVRIKEALDNKTPHSGDNVTRTPTLSPQGRGGIPDVGFKVFKLDTSNLVKWDDTPLDSTETADLFNRLDGMEKSLKKDRTVLDVVYEVMAKLGIPLTYKVSELNINSRKVYSIGDDGLILVCLDASNGGITPEDITAMCDLAPAKIIAAEEAFKDDVSLSNAYYISKDSGVAIELL